MENVKFATLVPYFQKGQAPTQRNKMPSLDMMGQIIVLVGKTLKGKNRVREHGSSWLVTEQTDTTMLVQPAEPQFNAIVLRWIKKNNDPDFNWSKESKDDV